MIATRRITFRLYASKTQTKKLFDARRPHAYLYNACVEHRKTSYQRFAKSTSYYDQQAAIVPFKDCWVEYKALNHGSLQATVKRVDFAYQRFFKGKGDTQSFSQSEGIQVGHILMLGRDLRFIVQVITAI